MFYLPFAGRHAKPEIAGREKSLPCQDPTKFTFAKATLSLAVWQYDNLHYFNKIKELHMHT
jgi:hypothetical protein